MTFPLWHEVKGPRFPALAGRQTADLAIIGAGMTGLALACFAARRGFRPVVVDGRRIGGGASGRNAGMVITGLGEHYARSVRGFGRARATEIWKINRANHRLLQDLLEAEDIACDYRRTGSFALAWDEAERQDLCDSVAPMGEDGFPAELLDESAIRRELGLSGAPVALYVPEDAQLHPVKLLQGLAAAADRLGAAIHEESEVLSLSRRGSELRLELPHGSLHCHAVALATNAWTPLLREDFRAWIEPVRGQCLAAVLPEGSVVPAPVYADRGQVYWRSWEGRLVLGGFDGLSPETERTYGDETTEPIQGALEAFAGQLIRGRWVGPTASRDSNCAGPPAAADGGLMVSHRWSGTMGYGRDWFPFIGESPAGSGIHVAAGFTGHGFGYAFLAALWLSLLIAGEPAPVPDFLSASRIG